MDNYLMRLYRSMMGQQQAQPQPAMLGSGAAAQAGEILQSMPYRRYVQEQQAMGAEPLDPQSWMKQLQGLQRTAY
jgi:hypothetical protein